MKKRNKKRSGFMPAFSLKGEVARHDSPRAYNSGGQEEVETSSRDVGEAWAYAQWLFDVYGKGGVIDSHGAERRLDNTITSDRNLVTRSRHDYDGLCRKALAHGARIVGRNCIDWPIHGDCQNRYTATFKVLPYLDPAGRKTKRTYSIYVDIHTRCRKCEKCLLHRASLWRVRALNEYRSAPRTWFGTLTLRPDRMLHFRFRAIQRAIREGVHFEGLPAAGQFARVHAEISRELTKGLKRLRHAAPFKYILVAEAHKSGNPHYHLLFHERNANKPLLYADLKRYFWREGFSNYKLVVEPKQATYLCKYLSKSLLARVRASQRYGCESTINPLQIAKGLSVKTTTPNSKTATRTFF